MYKIGTKFFSDAYPRLIGAQWEVTEHNGSSYPYDVVCIKGNGTYSKGYATQFKDDGDMQLIKAANDNNMEKYYRLKKDTPSAFAGHIIKSDSDGDFIDVTDLFLTDAGEKCFGDGGVWSKDMVIDNEEWFERVYPVNLLTKTVYKLKAEARELFSKEHTA